METSNTLNELATALKTAQQEMPPVEQNAVNPFLKNRFADLGAVISASIPVLAKHGLSISQFPTSDGASVGVTTVLMHASGQYIRDTLYLPLSDERGKSLAQVAGSIITYLRRYAWSAVLGLYTDEDNDGSMPTGQQSDTRPGGPRQTAQTSSGNTGGYIDVVEVGRFKAKNGKEHIGFMADGSQWPDLRWFRGRDALLEAAPWISQSATKEQLGEVGNRFPFEARVYYTVNDKGFKDIERIERAGEEYDADTLQAALDYVTAKGTRLGGCTPEQLNKLLDWATANEGGETAAIAAYVPILLDYLEALQDAPQEEELPY